MAKKQSIKDIIRATIEAAASTDQKISLRFKTDQRKQFVHDLIVKKVDGDRYKTTVSGESIEFEIGNVAEAILTQAS